MWSATAGKCVDIASARYFFSHVLGCFAVAPTGSEGWKVAVFATGTKSTGTRVQEGCTDMGWESWTVENTKCVQKCAESTFRLAGQCVVACPQQSRHEQLSHGVECVVARTTDCAQPYQVVVDDRQFCTRDCADYSVIVFGEEVDMDGKIRTRARAQCLKDVPELSRAWRSEDNRVNVARKYSVWISKSCASFTKFCADAEQRGGICRYGTENKFQRPLELAGQCVNYTAKGCAYLVSEEEFDILENKQIREVVGGVCGPRCPYFLWRFGTWRVEKERWRVCVDACADDEVEIVSGSANSKRDEPRQCTRCLHKNALSGKLQYLHPGEGPNGIDVCDTTPC